MMFCDYENVLCSDSKQHLATCMYGVLEMWLLQSRKLLLKSYLILIYLYLNSHMWPVGTILDSVDLE